MVATDLGLGLSVALFPWLCPGLLSQLCPRPLLEKQQVSVQILFVEEVPI